MFSTIPNIEFSSQPSFALQEAANMQSQVTGLAGRSGGMQSLLVTEADQVSMGQRAMSRQTTLQGAQQMEYMRALSQKNDDQAFELISDQLDITLANREATMMMQKLSGQFSLMSKIQQNLST